MHKFMKKLYNFQPSLPISHFSSLSSLSSAPQTQESVVYLLKNLDKNPEKALQVFDHAVKNNSSSLSPTSYNLMLRILASHKAHISEFWQFLNTMYDSGQSLEKDTYFTILYGFKNQNRAAEVKSLKEFYAKKMEVDDEVKKVESFCEKLKNVEDGSLFSVEAVKRLKEVDLNLSELNVIKIIREMREYPTKALGFFRWVSEENPEFKQKSVIYNAMARVLGRDNSIDRFWDLIEEMKEIGILLDFDTYIKLLRQFVKSKMLEDAVKLFEYMMDGPFKPSTENSGFLLRQISEDLDLVKRVVNAYESGGNSLSKVIYDGMHRALTYNGKFDEAEETIKKMKEAGYEPDNTTYSQLVYGLCKAKKLDEACSILDKMQEAGCVPDVMTWSVLIKGHCQMGQVDKALECLSNMVKSGVEADGDVMDILVKSLCGDGRLDGAYTFFNELVETVHVKPWQATYKYMIEELLRGKKLEEALKMVHMMKSHKYPPFAEPFPKYIATYGTVEDAKEFLKALSVKEYPTHTAYLYVFKAFFDTGRYAEAQELLFKTPHHIRKHTEVAKLFGSVNK